MLFNRNKKNSAEQPVEQTEEGAQQNKKGFFARQADKVKQVTQKVSQGFKQTTTQVKAKAEQIKQEVDEKFAFVRKLQLIFTVVATLFFIVNSLFWVFNKWGEFGNLLWVMLAVTVGYILVFAVTLIKHRQDGKQMQTDTQRFKIQLNTWRALADILFIALSAIMLFQNLTVWRAEGGVFTLVSLIVSGVLLFIKLLSTVIKLFKLNGKRKKLNKKEAKRLAKQQKLQQAEEQKQLIAND